MWIFIKCLKANWYSMCKQYAVEAVWECCITPNRLEGCNTDNDVYTVWTWYSRKYLFLSSRLCLCLFLYSSFFSHACPKTFSFPTTWSLCVFEMKMDLTQPVLQYVGVLVQPVCVPCKFGKCFQYSHRHCPVAWKCCLCVFNIFHLHLLLSSATQWLWWTPSGSWVPQSPEIWSGLPT